MTRCNARDEYELFRLFAFTGALIARRDADDLISPLRVCHGGTGHASASYFTPMITFIERTAGIRMSLVRFEPITGEAPPCSMPPVINFYMMRRDSRSSILMPTKPLYRRAWRCACALRQPPEFVTSATGQLVASPGAPIMM